MKTKVSCLCFFLLLLLFLYPVTVVASMCLGVCVCGRTEVKELVFLSLKEPLDLL